VERSSRGRFAMPADFPLHDCRPYQGLHTRRESVGVFHRSRAIFYRCRAKPQHFDSQLFHRCIPRVLRNPDHRKVHAGSSLPPASVAPFAWDKPGASTRTQLHRGCLGWRAGGRGSPAHVRASARTQQRQQRRRRRRRRGGGGGAAGVALRHGDARVGVAQQPRGQGGGRCGGAAAAKRRRRRWG
jgi:hypothetical protein